MELSSDRGRLGLERDEAARLGAATLRLKVVTHVFEHFGEYLIATIYEHVNDARSQQIAVLVEKVAHLFVFVQIGDERVKSLTFKSHMLTS